MIRRAILYLLLLLTSATFGADVNHDDHDNPPPGPGSGPRRPGARPDRQNGGRCQATGPGLADIANGSRDFRQLVAYLTSPDCVDVQWQLSQSAISQGVNFSGKGPFNLENYSKYLYGSDYQSSFTQLDSQLQKTLPSVLRENPQSSSELSTLAGKVALLSPSAAKGVIANLIEQEVKNGAVALSSQGDQTPNPKAVASLAAYISSLGAAEPGIASLLAANVEDGAVRAQSDSLATFFRVLGILSNADPGLAQTFNLSASALNRGVRKGKKFYGLSELSEMQKAIFAAIKAAVLGSENLESGAQELNEAVANLITGKPLQETALRKVWREILRVLAQSVNQTVLAQAFSLSLTPDLIFLPISDMHVILEASQNYPPVALAIQAQSVEAWQKIFDDRDSKKTDGPSFAKLRARYMDPMVQEMLEFGVDWINPRWLRFVAEKGLLSDEQIEKKLPRLTLGLLFQRERSARKLASDSQGVEREFSLLAQDFSHAWVLSSVYVPILRVWVKRHEKDGADGAEK